MKNLKLSSFLYVIITWFKAYSLTYLMLMVMLYFTRINNPVSTLDYVDSNVLHFMSTRAFNLLPYTGLSIFVAWLAYDAVVFVRQILSTFKDAK